MTVRRVVTGQNAAGESVLVEDATIRPAVTSDFPGFEPHEIGAADGTATLPTAALDVRGGEYFPAVDGPYMHVTDTVDHVYTASGEVVLTLADGTEIALRTGDTVVQQGARHSWHNRSDEPCVVVGALVGARRRPAASD